MVAQRVASHHKKRHGKHQKQTKDFLRVYWPYVPLLLIVTAGLLFSSYWRPRTGGTGVLAYATSMSQNALLSSTNQQRAANGRAALSLNSSLNQAAQAKANDMAARNYWSHNTPEGNPPWIFIDQAGYAYQKAGENLAYGFATSEDTITGWMNSPTHKDNLLGSDYLDVGFGFANSSDYQSTGPETIVVAMYGKPANVVAPAPAPVSPPVAATKPAVQAQTNAVQPTPSPAPATEIIAEAPVPEEAVSQPVTTDSNLAVEPPPKTISRLGALTGSDLPWLATALSFTASVGGALVVLKHGVGLRRWLVRGERYVLHHVVFDITIISLIGLCLIAGQAAGVVR